MALRLFLFVVVRVLLLLELPVHMIRDSIGEEDQAKGMGEQAPSEQDPSRPESIVAREGKGNLFVANTSRFPTNASDDYNLVDIYIVATRDIIEGNGYAGLTLPIWRAYATRRGYGLHVVRNLSICARHMNFPEYSHWAQANWAKVCLASELLSTWPGGEQFADYDLDPNYTVDAQVREVRETNTGTVVSSVLEASVEAYVVIIDADVLVRDPNFKLRTATGKFFQDGASVLMLENRSSLDDYPGCYGNGRPDVEGLGVNTCLPQGSFMMFKRTAEAKMFADHWLEHAREGPCDQTARHGSYPEQDTLKNCALPTWLKKSTGTFRVTNGFQEIMTNNIHRNSDTGLAHFPLSLKSNISRVAQESMEKFKQSDV